MLNGGLIERDLMRSSRRNEITSNTENSEVTVASAVKSAGVKTLFELTSMKVLFGITLNRIFEIGNSKDTPEVAPQRLERYAITVWTSFLSKYDCPSAQLE